MSSFLSMRYIGDFHIHSKFSRATSQEMEPEALARWAKLKGIDILGSGDFTHPAYFAELKSKLEPAEKGLYKFKDERNGRVRFILTSEISCIYSKGNKVRKVHILLFAPSLAVVEKINARLSWVGNLRSDGRPILGLDAKELAKIVLGISSECLVVPAHAWTPWFSIFGSKSGFDTIEECFDEYAKYIYAIETGLSSDPVMNWRLSKLDKITLISNSDAHSGPNLGREANIFEGEEVDYYSIIEAIKRGAETEEKQKLKFSYTIEFFPEEGKYHFDGHRLCKISYSPEETKKHKGICPVCGKPLTLGVMYRVDELADRSNGERPAHAVPYKNIIPLEEIIADGMGVGKTSKMVRGEYLKLVEIFGNEFNILLDVGSEDLEKATFPSVAEGIVKMREGKVYIKPGYDGEYGVVKISHDAGIKKSDEADKPPQQALF